MSSRQPLLCTRCGAPLPASTEASITCSYCQLVMQAPKTSREEVHEVVREVLATERAESDTLSVEGYQPPAAPFFESSPKRFALFAGLFAILGLTLSVVFWRKQVEFETEPAALRDYAELQPFREALGPLPACELSYDSIGVFSTLSYKRCQSDESHTVQLLPRNSSPDALIKLQRSAPEEPWQILPLPRNTDPGTVAAVLTVVTPHFVRELGPASAP